MSHRWSEDPVLPEFNRDGVLPPCDYELTVAQIQRSMLVRGPSRSVGSGLWDQSWRQVLVANLAVLVNQLQQIGVSNIYINGSFVEDKNHPNDIDA